MRSKFHGMMSLGLALLMAACTDEFTPGADRPLLAVRVSTNGATSANGNMWLGDTTLFVGDTTTIIIRVTDRFGRSSKGNRGVSFQSRDESVLTVGGSSGLVTVMGVGTTHIVMKASSGFRDSLAVSIAPLNPVVPPVAPPEPPAPEPPAPEQPAPGDIVMPTLPQATVSTALPAVTGKRWSIPAGDMTALQNAVNGAVAGDEIVLPNNSEFVGSLSLGKHEGTGVVTIRSETVPIRDVRVTPASAASLARIVTTDARPAIGTSAGARGWRVVGVQALQRNDGVMNYGIVRLGSGAESTLAEFVDNIVLDRIFVSAGAQGSTRRCVALNGSNLGVINSWLVECHSKGFDSQAVGGWTGTGPILVENNHLEASTETVAWGGADPGISGMTPSDITIRRNHMVRPMAWAGSGWLIKNHFELKHAKRLLFEGNVLENNWIHGQVGYAILFQSVTDGAPWTTIQDITVRNNVIRNSTSGIHILSRGNVSTEPSQRIQFSNNLFENVGRDPVTGGNGRLMQILSDVEHVSVISNTFTGGNPNDILAFDLAPQKGLRVIGNVFQATAYGVIGNVGEGTVSMEKFAPGYVVSGNVFTGRPERLYPQQNFFPASMGADAFVNPSAGDYTLKSSLPYAFSGGKLVGVNGQTLLAATQNAVTR